jgi:hypothetical protein
VRDLCRTALAATVQPRPDSVAADRLADSCKSPPIREGPSPHLYGGNSGLTPGPSTIDNLQNAHRAAFIAAWQTYCLWIQTQISFRSFRPNCFSGGSIVNGEAGCMVCNQPRVLKVLFPVGKGYELKLYEPP